MRQAAAQGFAEAGGGLGRHGGARVAQQVLLPAAHGLGQQQPGFEARSLDGGGAQVLAGAAEEEADRAGGVGAIFPGGVQSCAAASRAASSSWVSASTISSNSPSITRSILCSVSPMRWSVTRPCGKL